MACSTWKTIRYEWITLQAENTHTFRSSWKTSYVIFLFDRWSSMVCFVSGDTISVTAHLVGNIISFSMNTCFISTQYQTTNKILTTKQYVWKQIFIFVIIAKWYLISTITAGQHHLKIKILNKTSSACWYRQKTGFPRTVGASFTGDAYTLANETADGTTWRRPNMK